MGVLRRDEVTAKSRSRNLKEHLEGFLSRNGVGPTQLPDPKTQMSGIVSQLLEFKYLTAKELTDAAFIIRRIPELKDVFKHSQVLTIFAKALGYQSHNELIANAVGDERVVLNRSYGIGLVNSEASTTSEQDEKTRKFWELCSEVFIYVKTIDIVTNDQVKGNRIDDLSTWYDLHVHPVADASNITVASPDGSELNWTAIVFSMALAAKYQYCLTRSVWKKAFKAIPDVVTAGECRTISTNLMGFPLKYLEELQRGSDA